MKKTSEKKPATVLVLRTSDKNRRSHGKFEWPESGPVEAPDWNPETCCGYGLHGLLWGEGDWSLMRGEMDAIWQVVEVVANTIVKIDDRKVKFPRGNVIYSGTMAQAITMVLNHQGHFLETLKQIQEAAKKAKTSVDGFKKAVSISGTSSTAATSGDYSTAATSGTSSKAASSGTSSTAATSGDYSTAATSGKYSTAASSGDYSKAASSGDYSTAATSGNYSKAATSGNYSKAASSGDYSKAATSGNYSKAATSGKNTIAMAAGCNCAVKAGENGCFATAYLDYSGRTRILVGYVGEDGIKADTFYRIEKRKFVEA